MSCNEKDKILASFQIVIVNMENIFVNKFERSVFQGCSLGLEVSVSRRSRDLLFKGLDLVSVSGNLGGSRSQSRLGLKTKCLGLVSVSKLKVSFTSESFLTVKLLIQNKLSSSVRVSHNHK